MSDWALFPDISTSNLHEDLEWIARGKVQPFPWAGSGTVRPEHIPGYLFQRLCQHCHVVYGHIAQFAEDHVYKKTGNYWHNQYVLHGRFAQSVYGDTSIEDRVFPHYDYLHELASSARQGCHMCSMLVQYAVTKPRLESTRKYVLWFLASLVDDHPARLVVKWNDGKEQYTDLISQRATQFISCMSSTILNSNTGDRRVLNLAKEWLDHCCSTHYQCRVEARRFQPSRLVRLDAQRGVPISARLVESAHQDNAPRYLTLSHCWGGADVTKLTTGTLQAFRVDIPISALPATFYDALRVTAHLGFEYIWIDSLCILQDSQEDWRRESQQMGRIYRNSDCTIAAVKARDSHDGLFSERFALSSAEFPFLGPRIAGLSLQNRRSPPEPLHTRAWVVQERCLSRRTLNFGADFVTWECRTEFLTEKGVGYKIDDGYEFYKAELQELLLEPVSRDMDYSSHVSSSSWPLWIVVWANILRGYSACNLSVAGDKYTAIGGIVELIREIRSVEIVFGLWRPFLATEVLWKTTHPREARLLPKVPTWSWINLESGVTNDIYHTKGKHTVILDPAVIETCSIDGEAVLMVTSKLSRLDAFRDVGIWVTSRDSRKYPFRFSNSRDRTPREIDGYWMPDILSTDDCELWAVRIAHRRQNIVLPPQDVELTEDDREYTARTVGLVVKPVAHEPDTFHRMGYFEAIFFSYEDSRTIRII